MKKIFLFLFFILFIITSSVFADGLNSTSIFSGISNSNINNIRDIVKLIIGAIILFIFLFIVYKISKKIDAVIKNMGCGCGCGLSVFELLIVVSIIAILAAMSQPTCVRGSRWQARQKACYSNIRVIQGAVEMYNMDAPLATGTKNVYLVMKKLNMQNLVNGGYLKPGIKCPEANSDIYRAFGDLSKNGEIGCGDEAIGLNYQDLSKKYHGTLSGSDPSKKQ